MRKPVSTIAIFLATLLAVSGYTTPVNEFDRVAVIVIDDFEPDPAAAAEAPPTANCPYLPEDVNVVGDQGAGDGIPEGTSHGDAVYEQLADELDSVAGLTRLDSLRPRTDYGLDSTAIDRVTGWAHSRHEILLVGIDTSAITTEGIAHRVRHVTSSMQASYGFNRFVLNMSFVIAPCNVAGWLEEIGELDVDQVIAHYQALINENPGLQHLQETLDALVADPATLEAKLLAADPDDGLVELRRHAAISQFYGLFLTHSDQVWERINNDPIKELVTEFSGSPERVIPVAAAGNGVLTLDPEASTLQRVRFDFPFAPAIWNPVVSTSADDDGTRATYSNSGEVMLAGATQVPPPSGKPPVTVNGTSFAAPRLSALQAVYLLTGGKVSCGGAIPPLGYTNSELSGQWWLDMTVTAAASAHCPEFTTRTTLTP